MIRLAVHAGLLSLGLLLAAPPAGIHAQAGSPADAVPPALLQARREALLARLGTGVAVLEGEVVRSIDPPDSDYPQDSDFRQDNDVFYLTGLEEPGAWLVLIARADGPDEVRLYLPRRNPAEERWLGVRLGPGPAAAALAGLAVDAVLPADSIGAVLGALVRAPDSPARRGALYLKQSRRTSRSAVLQGLAGPGARVEDLIPHLTELRLVKDADEVRRMRRAVDVSIEGHLAAWRSTTPGAWEYELEAAAEGTFRRLGAERVGYPSIVGTGANGAILHYMTSRSRLAAGDLVVMDMGAEFGYYSADLTRTVPASGTFTPRQRALYDLVLGTQQAALDSVRPGISLARLNQIARTWMREHSGELCAPRTCEVHFIHGLGHHVGMDVHDPGGTARPLTPGMLLTIEPGLYLPEEALGIRIEDVVLVTATGHEVLSARLPRAAAAVEAFLAR